MILSFCELVSPALRIYCDNPGKPVIFACAHETRLTGRFVLATLPSEVQSASNSQCNQLLVPTYLMNKTPVQLRSTSTLKQDKFVHTNNME